MPVNPAALEEPTMLADRQSPQLLERPPSTQGRKRGASSLQKELEALGAEDSLDSDGSKRRRLAAIASDLKPQQGRLYCHIITDTCMS